jgi:hypothetical protein
MSKTQRTRRPRNPVAKAVRTPQYRMRTEPDKRRKLLESQDKRKRRSDDEPA